MDRQYKCHCCFSLITGVILALLTTISIAAENASVPPPSENSWESQNSWNVKNQVESRDQKIRVRWAASPTPAFLSDTVVLSLEIVHTLDLEWIPLEFADTLGDFAVDHVQVDTAIIEDDREFHKIKVFLLPQATGRNMIGAVPLRFEKLAEPLLAAFGHSADSQLPPSPSPQRDVNSTGIHVVVPPQNKDIQLSLPVDASIESLHQPSGPIAIASYFGYYLGGTVFALLFIATLVFRAVKNRAQLPTPIPKLSPQQIAMKRLTALIEQGINERDAKEFYFEITNIVRWFVEQKTNIRAPELTTEEFLREITTRCEEASRQTTSLLTNPTQGTRTSHKNQKNKEKSQFISLAEMKTQAHCMQTIAQDDYDEIEVPYDHVGGESHEENDEIKSFFSEKNRISLSSFLEIADLVKFARHQPTHKEMMLAFRKASEFFNLGNHLKNEKDRTSNTHITLSEESQKTGFGTGSYGTGSYGTGSHTETETHTHGVGTHNSAVRSGVRNSGVHNSGLLRSEGKTTGLHNTAPHRKTGVFQVEQFSGAIKTGAFENGTQNHDTSSKVLRITHSQDDLTKPNDRQNPSE